MKNRKVGQWLCRIFWFAQLGAECLAGFSAWKLNMLPNLYFSALVLVFAMLLGITGLILKPFGRKKPGLFRIIFGGLLAVAVIAGCLFGGSVADSVSDMVDDITVDTQTVSVSMAVYVPVEDPAQFIGDTGSYVFGALDNYETERTHQALEQLRQTLGTDVQVIYYETLVELIAALERGEADALILNSAYVSILEDTEEFRDLPRKLRVLHTEVIQETLPPETQPPAQIQTLPTETLAQTEPEPPFSITSSPFIVYVSGSDTRDYYLSTSRSDVNILAVVNPVSKMVLLINTPRDTFVSNPAGGGAKDKLTHCGISGIDCSIGALEDLYGIDVRYYAQINFTGVETLVDAVGGVDVYAEYGFTAMEVYPINSGWNHLNGKQALAFAQDRYSHADGDHARGRNQMKVIRAILEKATSGSTIMNNYAKILASLQGLFRTNVSTEEIGELVKMQLGDMARWNVVTYALTGEGASAFTYSIPGLRSYVMYPDESRVAYASELIQRVYRGDVLTSEDMTPRQ